MPFVALTVVGAFVFLVTTRLARQADIIAAETGLGRLWIGTTLLAASTSLPELLTSLNAGLLEEPDIGAGDLLGASLANMLILAVVDLVFPRRRILQSVAVDHALGGLLGILLAAIVGAALYTGGWGSLGHVGLESVAILLVYLRGLGLLYRSALGGAAPPGRSGLRGAFMGFAAGVVGLVLLAPLLVLSADAFSTEAGISATLVGTLLVGLSTSLPELAATVAAVRVGALDLAAGNVFGSVAFNLLVVAVLDAAYLPGPVAGALSRGHALSVWLLVLCLALTMMAILSGARRRPGPVRVESVLVVAAYVFVAGALFRLGQ